MQNIELKKKKKHQRPTTSAERGRKFRKVLKADPIKEAAYKMKKNGKAREKRRQDREDRRRQSLLINAL